jgi:hypothetical protein
VVGRCLFEQQEERRTWEVTGFNFTPQEEKLQ